MTAGVLKTSFASEVQRYSIGSRHANIILTKLISSRLWGSSFLTHGYSVGVFVSHRYHSISISASFCVLIASSLLCAPGGNRLDQSRTSLEDFSREPVRPVYTLDLLFICSNLHCKNCSAFIEKEFIPVAFLSYTCNYYNRLYVIVSTNFAISRFTDFIGSFVVSELSV